jgi:uncharacterized coiled-coil protein SlyX
MNIKSLTPRQLHKYAQEAQHDIDRLEQKAAHQPKGIERSITLAQLANRRQLKHNFERQLAILTNDAQ